MCGVGVEAASYDGRAGVYQRRARKRQRFCAALQSPRPACREEPGAYHRGMSNASSTPGPSLLPAGWQLPAIIRSRIGRDAGPQRAMFEDGHLLLILHEMPAPDGVERKPAFFWRSSTGEWKASRSQLPSGTMTDFLKTYEDRLLKLDAQESQAAVAADHHGVLESTAPVLRAARGLHRSLQQARDMVKEDRELINHRDRAAAVERTAELLVQDAQFGLSYIAARQSEAQAESAARMASAAYRLNVLAALFLPLTAVASVLGMEIHSGVSNTQQNFWLVVALGVCLGLIFALMVRRKG